MVNNKKEALKKELLNNDYVDNIHDNSNKSKCISAASKILLEWSLEKGNGFIKLYVEKTKNGLGLFLLTEQNHLGLEDLIGYEIDTSLEQLQNLSVNNALRLYYYLLATSVKNIQKRLSREAS